MLTHSYAYDSILADSIRVGWRVDDIIGGDQKLDFSKNFLPEGLAGVQGLAFLSDTERRTLNQIRGNSYLYLFGFVEEFILPFVLGEALGTVHGDSSETRALVRFADEEAKHIDLFRRFAGAFGAGFGTKCGVIGPASEEAQHARVDTLLVARLAIEAGPAGIAKAFDDYLDIAVMLGGALAAQVDLDIAALTAATGRVFTDEERAQIFAAQQKSYRWTFLVSGATHPNFVRALNELSPEGAAKIAGVAAALA